MGEAGPMMRGNGCNGQRPPWRPCAGRPSVERRRRQTPSTMRPAPQRRPRATRSPILLWWREATRRANAGARWRRPDARTASPTGRTLASRSFPANVGKCRQISGTGVARSRRARASGGLEAPMRSTPGAPSTGHQWCMAPYAKAMPPFLRAPPRIKGRLGTSRRMIPTM